MTGGNLDDFLREMGILAEVEVVARQRAAALPKESDDSAQPAWKRLHNSGTLKARPDESVWPAAKTA
jgi:hypothetical protein